MKTFFFTISMALLFAGTPAEAMLCRAKNKLIVRCQKGICLNGILIPRRGSGFFCGSISNLKDDDIIFSLDDSIYQILPKNSKPHGYFALTFDDGTSFTGSTRQKLFCFQFIDETTIHLDCPPHYYNPKPLDFSPNSSWKEVKGALIKESRWAYVKSQIHAFSYPVLMAILIFLSFRYRKRWWSCIFVLLLLLETCLLGLSVLLKTYHYYWPPTAAVGFVALITWIILQAYRFVLTLKKRAQESD